MGKTIDITIANDWADVTINQYEELLAIPAGVANEDWVIAAMAILSNLSREEIMELPYATFVELSQRLQFMNAEPKTHTPGKHLTIEGRKFDVTTDARDVIAAQFLDFKTLAMAQDVEMRLARICSCFVIPGGQKYGTGYDTEAHVSFLHNHLGVVEALSLSVFFMKQWRESTRNTLRCLDAMLTRARRDATPAQTEQIQRIIDTLRAAKTMFSGESGGCA